VTPASQSALSIARGAVREGLAALDGFGELLGSRRVGPKALERARADLGEACASLGTAICSLASVIDEAFGEDEAARASTSALCAHAIERARVLVAAVDVKGPLGDARRRLALEAAVKRHGAELKDAVALCDLLAAAAAPAPTELDLLDVLEQRFGAAGRVEASVRVGIDAIRPAPLVADRHLFGALVEVAAAHAAKRGMASPRLGVVKWKDGSLLVRIGPSPRGSAAPRATMEIPVRGDVPGTLEAAKVAARRAGMKLEVDPATGAVTISVEPGPAHAKAERDAGPR